MNAMRRALAWLSIVAAASITVASAAPPAKPRAPEMAGPRAEYKIGHGDMLSIYFFEDQKTYDALVRPDGRITLPLVGDIEAIGTTPPDLAALIAKKLEPFQKGATISVAVKEIHSYQIVVLGRVGEQGIFESAAPLRLLQAIGRARGLNEFASKNIVVLREGPNGTERIAIEYDKIIKGKTPEMNILLQTGDVVVAE